MPADSIYEAFESFIDMTNKRRLHNLTIRIKDNKFIFVELTFSQTSNDLYRCTNFFFSSCNRNIPIDLIDGIDASKCLYIYLYTCCAI